MPRNYNTASGEGSPYSACLPLAANATL